MNSRVFRRLPVVVLALGCLAASTGSVFAAVAGGPPQGTQSDAAFADSYQSNRVSNVMATTQRVSCYAPEVLYDVNLGPANGYTGMTPCDGAATTGEDLGPYPTQNVDNPAQLVKNHSESDIRVDPTNPRHLIGQSKWIVSAEGYNHLNGFYESFDGGVTWPVQGHVPGYEGWTDVTDPVGAFDGYGNFYSLQLPYQFAYDNQGFHKYANGTAWVPNPTVPPEAVSVSVRPAGATSPNDWIVTHNGQPDYIVTVPNATTNVPDKQWIAIDINPDSEFYNRIYAMWTIFVFNPSAVYVSYADALPNGEHTDWSPPQELPTINGKPWDTYVLPHVAPDGTVYTTLTNNPVTQGFANADIYLVASNDGGVTWEGPLPVASGIAVPTYQNTTFREGIVNTFAVGRTLVNGTYPLYVSWEDGSSGVSNIYLSASYDDGHSWSAPILVNDNESAVDELQPNLHVTADGVVAVAFYDRRLACPTADSSEAAGSGIALDPGTSASPGTPWGRSNYCVNTAIQFYSPTLEPRGHNIRLSEHTWDPQLNAPHPSCDCTSGTFIGDYFGVASTDRDVFTTSVTTFNDGTNPQFYQQQVVAWLRVPRR